jgi:hypothetical protein
MKPYMGMIKSFVNLDWIVFFTSPTSMKVYTALAALCGVFVLTLSIRDYLRDTYDLDVKLEWDKHARGISGPDSPCGWVTVTQLGKRPITISGLHIQMPNNTQHSIALNIFNTHLSEGKPEVYTIEQKNLSTFARDWRKVKVYVTDHRGKRYFSKPVNKKPSWAE